MFCSRRGRIPLLLEVATPQPCVPVAPHTALHAHTRPHVRATNTPRQTHFARNFQRSFFKHARKRCNPNDQRSQFEVPSRELRAKFPETARPDTTASLPAIGGNCTIRGTTRRRHADSQLLMLQNPPPTPSWSGLVLWAGCFEGCWLLLVVLCPLARVLVG